MKFSVEYWGRRRLTFEHIIHRVSKSVESVQSVAFLLFAGLWPQDCHHAADSYL